LVRLGNEVLVLRSWVRIGDVRDSDSDSRDAWRGCRRAAGYDDPGAVPGGLPIAHPEIRSRS